MMIHFGLYSILGGEYKGKYMDQIGEWAQSYFRIPNKEYHALAKVFNPIYFYAVVVCSLQTLSVIAMKIGPMSSTSLMVLYGMIIPAIAGPIFRKEKTGVLVTMHSALSWTMTACTKDVPILTSPLKAVYGTVTTVCSKEKLFRTKMCPVTMMNT